MAANWAGQTTSPAITSIDDFPDWRSAWICSKESARLVGYKPERDLDGLARALRAPAAAGHEAAPEHHRAGEPAYLQEAAAAHAPATRRSLPRPSHALLLLPGAAPGTEAPGDPRETGQKAIDVATSPAPFSP